ncbi:MAG: hypothetical protein ABIA11_02555 [Patescibacteria group bacterium]
MLSLDNNMTNKTKNITFITKGEKLLVEEVCGIAADEVVDAIATTIPGINIAWKLSKAYFGRSMRLREQRALEWVEFVRDNLNQFSQKLFVQEKFQDCFVMLLEVYIKERAEKKRKIHQKLLLGLTEKNKKELEEFELEKMIWITNQISFDALNVLNFIKSNLLQKIEEDVQKLLSVFKDQEGVEGIRLEDITRARIIVSDYISKWIYENYNTNSDAVKVKYGYTNTPQKDLWHKIAYEEHLKEKELMGPLPELANLGILIEKNGTATWGGTVGSGYSLSEFGYKYILYLT